MEYRTFQGTNGLFGVEDSQGGLLYEADFTEPVAERIAELENSDEPPADWEATSEILEQEGLL